MSANTNSDCPPACGPTHGQLCYLQIPAIDPMASAAFYEKIFGWRIERPDASFESPGLIGQWVTDRPPTPDSGLLAWINVNNIDTVLNAARTNGGQVVKFPYRDGPRTLATLRDPAGNVIGIVQHNPRSAT